MPQTTTGGAAAGPKCGFRIQARFPRGGTSWIQSNDLRRGFLLNPKHGDRIAAVLLDRDGTIIEDVGYIGRPEQLSLYPWSIDSIRALNQAGICVVVTTNQSGVARGYLTETMLESVHRHLSSLAAAGGARIDAFYYCPHHPDGTVAPYACRCDCRKPGRALADRAAADLGLDLTRSFVVGDKWLDVGLARAVGARAVLVRTGYGTEQEADPPPDLTADVVVDDLAAAVRWILQHR